MFFKLCDLGFVCGLLERCSVDGVQQQLYGVCYSVATSSLNLAAFQTLFATFFVKRPVTNLASSPVLLQTFLI